MAPVTSRARRALALAASVLLAAASPAVAQVPSPEAFFGFRMGADRQLADAEAIERYFEQAAAGSNRVHLVTIGATTEGRRTVAAIVSSPDNLSRLADIQDANRRLADPRTLSPDEAQRLAKTHKAVLAIGCSIHASEIGATQAANELLHRLATATDPDTLAILDSVVVIIIPMLNPDGHRLVTDWYTREKGTPFEGGAMPWLYHKYAGHDINRDGFMMNLAENRSLAAFFYGEWHPQVFLTMHQMGTTGPRFFVPPNTDPIDTNYDPLIWRTAGLLGGAMAFELQRDGHRGVLSNGIYDYYWPGYEDSAPLGHNTVCLLTEVASVRIASPITVTAGDLRGGQKGLPEYRPQINFPDPWPGGDWTLRDIVDYDLSAVNGLMKAVARYREPIVQNFYDMGRRAIDDGRRGGPFAFLIPPGQFDTRAASKLRELLLQGHIEIQRALEPFRADGDPYPAGTDIILMAQPFRAYVKTLLERQRYPARRTARESTNERPYDVTGWTLPLQMGVDVRTVERSFTPPPMSRVTSAAVEPAQVVGERKPGHYLIDARGNAGALAAAKLVAAGLSPSWITASREVDGATFEPGSIVVPHTKSAEGVVAGFARDLGIHVRAIKGKPPATNTTPIGRARVAVYRPWSDNVDEGWTRWALDTYGFSYTSVHAADIRQGRLRARYDAIIIPSAPVDRLINGNSPGSFPPEYVAGIGEDGIAALRAFVEDGGTLICIDQADGLALKAFDLPVREVARSADGFFCPGSIVRLELDPAKPLAYGMRAHTAAFFAFSAAYVPAGSLGDAEGDRASSGAGLETVARYGNQDVLLSGYLEGEEVIAGRSAVVQASVGAGRVVLFGFPPQHRGQSHATFRLLFNAILTTPGDDRFRNGIR